MRSTRFTRSVQQFCREEDGVAFITFGMFLALLMILLLAAVLDWGWRSFKSRDEMGEKTQEYSTLLTQEYGELWLKRALCIQSAAAGTGADCNQNADSTRHIFSKPLNTYVYAGGSDPTAAADMQEYLNKAFNEDIGALRFQKSEVPKVAISCFTPANRMLLTFTTQAPSFNTFWSEKTPLVQVVKRLSSVPCDMGDIKITPCTGTKCAEKIDQPMIGAACAHNKKMRDGSKVNTESVEFTPLIDKKNQINLGSVRSVVNFIVSLDANSKASLGGTSNYISRFAGSLFNASGTQGDLSMIGAGLTIGNWPQRGNGPNCAYNYANLQHSGSCYDDAPNFTGVTRTGPNDPAMDGTGWGNNNRKDPFTGEFRAQYTRRCPASEARWTYEEVRDRGCYEETYESTEVTIGGHQPSTVAEHLDIEANRVQKQNDLFAANGGSSFCASNGYPDGTTGFNLDTNTPVPNACGLDAAAITAGQRCYKFSINCVQKKHNDQDVMRGQWYASCRSQNLGAVASNIYGDPKDYLDFRARIAADLEGTLARDTQHLNVELKADIKKALAPEAMRATDSGVLKQINELTGLHVKNTERAFYWACQKGPTDTATNKPADNDGNLGAPFGARKTGQDLVKDDGTETTTAQNIVIDSSGSKGCKIPVIGAISNGKMTETVNTYDLTFKRNDCTGDCGIPEALYAISLQPGTTPLQTAVVPSGIKTPLGGLTTKWKPSAGQTESGHDYRWAWGAIGTVTAGDGSECPIDSAAGPCPGGYITNMDGRQFCRSKVYDNTHHVNKTVCNDDGSGCPNIARYGLATAVTGVDDNNYTDKNMTPERLNISSVAMERRLMPDPLTGKPMPYTCMLDKGETKTSKRVNYTAIAGGPQDTNPQCKGAPFFCQKDTSPVIPADQVEQNFIDDANTGADVGGGIFSLTANNFTAPVPIGDDAEEFGGQAQKTNFKTRKIAQGQLKSKIDDQITIMPAQVETEEVVHYVNTDLAPDNMDILDTATQFKNVVKEVAKGYGDYNIFPYHNGNQCALFRQGLKNLWRQTDGVVAASKFAVWIGALPTKADYAALDPRFLAHAKAQSAGSPGEYDPPTMSVKKPLLLADEIKDSDMPAKDIVEKCFSAADNDNSTTPFLVTTLPATAQSSEISGLLKSLETATQNTTNESCKRPFCLLSNKDGELGGVSAQNIMTPETCAAKLWKCIKPADSKF